ncbi:TIGR03943 family putative permease subunit [Salipaludibacillus aurantiacus]|uniref:Putative membrane protein n=1 Tax=Salipaludibacillus aurantiacus TaxID=1601833 RepID=A0A1H9PFH5_9BACI|nr:TIGR03943 family protein [Salipaludibacillus aurantiacus]SER46934.1 putative membrane protein [Salipaludibacillus aurantiacus]
MKNYDYSFHAFIQGIILIGFAMLILSLVLTGNIVYYIAPSMMPFIYFALVTFFILGIVQVFRSTKNDEEDSSCGCEHEHQISGPSWLKLIIYGIFILPVLFGFTLPDRSLDSSVAANRGIQFGGGSNPQAAEGNVNSATEAENGNTARAEAYLDDPEGYLDSIGASSEEEEEHYTMEEVYDEEWFDDYYQELAEEMLEKDTVLVTDENYLDMMTVLDLYLDEFIGNGIEITGFAYREPGFDPDQIVAARFAMTCCTADASVYGTMIEAAESGNVEDDTWIVAWGTIEKGHYKDQQIPVVTDAHIEEIDEPESPYVYPNF